jgi:hypothetical protein
VAIPNPDHDPSEKKGKGNRNFHLFATNVEFTSAEKFIKMVPEEYRKRWNIETGYRSDLLPALKAGLPETAPKSDRLVCRTG